MSTDVKQESYPSSNQAQDVIITATESSTLPAAPEPMQSTFTSLVPMLLIFVVFYFFLIRPQEKKRKAQQQLISTVKVGEEVLLHSGIYGRVAKVNDDDSIILQIAKDVEIKALQSAIADIISRKSGVKTEESKSPASKALASNSAKANKKGKK